MNEKREEIDFLAKEIGVRFRKIRENRGYTREFVGHNTGCNMARIEKGRHLPTFMTIHRLCTFYGTMMEEFLRGM